MPSIRLTPLQPTTFDLWRDRVLTVPRRTLLQEAAAERDVTTGSFLTLARSLVGEDDNKTLAGELGKLAVVLKDLLADQRGGRFVGIGQSSAEIREALSGDGAVAQAIHDCAVAIANLDVEAPEPEPEPGEPSEPGIPNADGMLVLRALDKLREPLLSAQGASKVNQAVKNWLASVDSQRAIAILELRGDPWPDRYSALGEFFTVTTNGIDEDERRERLGQLVALEFDVTHELFVDNDPL